MIILYAKKQISMISVEAQLQSCRPGFAAGQAAASQFVYACFAPEVTCCYAQGLYSLGFVSCLPLVLVIISVLVL